MAKGKSQNAVPLDASGSMTVFMFQVKGSDMTLQQGFKLIESAFQKLSPGMVPPKPSLASRTLTEGYDGEVGEPDEAEVDVTEEEAPVISGEK